MDIILATKSTIPIIGQLASLMGWIMNGIYKMFDGLFGIQNLGLCIIVFSIDDIFSSIRFTINIKNI